MIITLAATPKTAPDSGRLMFKHFTVHSMPIIQVKNLKFHTELRVCE